MSPSAALTEVRQPTRSRGGAPGARTEATLIWSISSLTQYGLTVLVTGITCMASWYNVSGKAEFAKQVPAINVAIVSLVIASSGGISFLLAGRRAVGLRRQALLGEPAAVTAAAPVAVIPHQETRGLVDLVGGAGLTHYHRSDCAMAVGRAWPAAASSTHVREGRTPCGVCQP